MIETIAETGSTNADLLVRAETGAPEGLWLRAVRQVAGKGRLGRVWEGREGNLFISGIVRLRAGDPAAASLSFVAGLALWRVIAPYAATGVVRLKWPNDVLADGAKLAGILLERSGDAVVVGIGVNIAYAPDVQGRAVAALAQITDVAPDAATVAEDLASSFALTLAEWRALGLDAVLAGWQAAAHMPGEPMRVKLGGDECVVGRYSGLTPDGALRLTVPDGTEHVVHAGDVELITDRGAGS